jgi:hypothetical protein
MRTYLEELVDNPAVTIYDPMSGRFLKVGQTLEENPDAETITPDSLDEARTVQQIMLQRKGMTAALTKA